MFGNMILVVVAFFMLYCSCFCWNCGAMTDTISTSKFITDGEVITSNASRFQLGFFSPANSTNRYLGIWYNGTNSVEGVIWVANRENPLKESSGTVMISKDGNIVILNGLKEVVWSSNVTNSVSKNTTAQLLDSGNLVLVDDFSDRTNILWESFQQPSNVAMPTMNLGITRTGKVARLTSWKSPSDPSAGNFSVGIYDENNVEFYMWKNSKPYWRSGTWNGQVFLGISSYTYTLPLHGFTVWDENGDLHVSFEFKGKLLDFYLAPQGNLVIRIWMSEGLGLVGQTMVLVPRSECAIYGKCGPFGSCDDDRKPNICSCLKGYRPKNTEEWSRGIWTSGCVRSTPLQCNRSTRNTSGVVQEDGFWKMEMMKVPAFAVQVPATEDICRSSCLSNCSCIAYAYDAGAGCMTWSETLIDVRKFSKGGLDLYIRLAHSELGVKTKDKDNLRLTVTVSTILGTVTMCICAFFFIKRQMAKGKERRDKSVEKQLSDAGEISRSDVQLQELPLFEFEELAAATNNFSLKNLLGRGGFGPVYRGTLKNGKEIAVKRLSSASKQGGDEFMTEVLVISKLQHRNLVRLLGCCIDREEKILIYEYMTNKSLDTYLFDPQRKEVVQWRTRFSIIEGISRGLIYLHRDSRLRIIHRDLKASNILLDENLISKISDFGTARIFGGNEDHANTNRIVGTYGYMAPEYAIEGLFSEKSDVFSFGVLLLEIVSGRKNTSFYGEECLNLLGYVWKLWKEGSILAFVDEILSESCDHGEVVRCIHVGLLCVQELAIDRPTMSTVLSMLNSEIVDLPSPKQPAFTLSQFAAITKSSEGDQKTCSVNHVTMTMVEGR